jgi:hypothetical protein
MLAYIKNGLIWQSNPPRLPSDWNEIMSSTHDVFMGPYLAAGMSGHKEE